MTEAAPDIPPWSPLADRARQLGEPGATATLEPVSTDEVDETPPGGDEAPRSRSRAPWWGVAGLAIGMVLAVLFLAVRTDDAPRATPTTVVRDPQPATTFADPAPQGSRVALGNGWTVSVRGFNPDVTRALRSANRTAAPLRDGQRYVLIDLEMTYLDGPEDAESPFYGVDLAVVGEDGRVVTTADSPCVAPRPALDPDTEVPRGDSERGRLCFAVDADQAASLRLVATPSMTIGATPSYLALNPPS